MARRNQVCRGKWLEAWERFLATAEILARRTFYTERLPQNVESVAADRHSPRQVWLRGFVVSPVFPATHSSAKMRRLSYPDLPAGPGARLRIFPIDRSPSQQINSPRPSVASWFGRVVCQRGILLRSNRSIVNGQRPLLHRFDRTSPHIRALTAYRTSPRILAHLISEMRANFSARGQ